MQAQVVAQQQRAVLLGQLDGALLDEQAVDELHRVEALLEHLVGEALLGDRARVVITQTPVVDGVRHDVDGASMEVGGQLHGDVLVPDADGEAQLLLVPERAAPERVPRGAVGQQRLEHPDVRAQPGLRERLRGVRRGLDAAVLDPTHAPGGEVRAALVERGEQDAVGVGREDVVAVGEGDELAAGRRRCRCCAPRPGRRSPGGRAGSARRAPRSATAISPLASVEPSSTITTSRSVSVWPAMEARHSSRYRATL